MFCASSDGPLFCVSTGEGVVTRNGRNSKRAVTKVSRVCELIATGNKISGVCARTRRRFFVWGTFVMVDYRLFEQIHAKMHTYTYLFIYNSEIHVCVCVCICMCVGHFWWGEGRPYISVLRDNDVIVTPLSIKVLQSCINTCASIELSACLHMHTCLRACILLRGTYMYACTNVHIRFNFMGHVLITRIMNQPITWSWYLLRSTIPLQRGKITHTHTHTCEHTTRSR